VKHAPTVLLVLLATSLAACAANEHRTADSTESAMEKSDSGPADEARGADPDENSPQSEPEPAANCPVGTWLAGDDDLDDYFDSAALAMAKSMPCEAEVVTPTDADTEASGNLSVGNARK
jgi:hypothetical protein